MKRQLIFALVGTSIALSAAVIVWAKLNSDTGIPTTSVGQVEAQTNPAAVADPVRGILADAPVIECGDLDLPENTEYDTTFDPISRKIRIDFMDPQSMTNRRIFISADDATCEKNLVARQLVTDVLESRARQLEQTCREMEEIVRTGVREVRGHPVNPEAAKGYVERWCKK